MAKITQRAFQRGSVCPTLEPGKLYLYGMRFCPYVSRVIVVLSAMNIEHEIININLDNKPEWFLEKSASGKVPLLEQDGKCISESLAIIEYLNDTYSENQLYPPPGSEKDHEKELMNITGDLLSPCLKYLKGLISTNEFWNIVNVSLDKYEHELNTRKTKFFGGEKPLILDYVLWPSIEFILALLIAKPDLESFPTSKYLKITEWINNMTEDSIIKKTCLDRKLIAAYLQTFNKNADFDIGL